jgi:hypothetical protein
MSVLQRQTRRPLLTKRLLAVADGARETLWPQWYQWFRDARTRLHASREVPDAMESPNLLAISALAGLIWDQAVTSPARRDLLTLGARILVEGVQASFPSLTALFGQRLLFVAGTPDVEQWLTQYVGTQVRDITATTLRTVPQVVREGQEAGASLIVRTRAIRDTFGLTPRQQQTLTLLQGRLERQGKHVRQVQQTLAQATSQALRARAQQIATSEGVTLANAGLYFATRQATQGGPISASAVRRYWYVVEDACAICAAIPALNPDGVGLDETFQTPIGPVLFPSVHPNCRCVCSTSLVAGIA